MGLKGRRGPNALVSSCISLQFFSSLFLQAGQSLCFFSFTWPSHHASSCISILARSEKEGKIDLDRKKVRRFVN